MPFFRIDNRVELHSVRSRLGKSLLRLHSELEKTRQEEHHVEDLFADWEKQWSSRRTQIAQRLELIEGQLSQLNDDERDSRCFSIVGVPADAEKMPSMSPV